MGINHEKCKEKIDVCYQLFGIATDVTQLAKAYIRGDTRTIKRNIKQIIRKLEKVSGSL